MTRPLQLPPWLPARLAHLAVGLRFGGRLVLAACKLTLLGVALSVLASLWVYYHYALDLPDPTAIRQHSPFETTRIYASDGETLLYELIDPQSGRRTIVPFDQIPRLLRQATVAVEDGGFYEHPGVDWRGVLRAAWQNYRQQEIVSGGSTITQQLVRNVLLPPEQRGRDAPLDELYERKLREAILAYRVSQEYSKDQILGLYLNEVYYGAQAYGVEAAAQVYFGKPVGALTAGEMTLLAGLPQSPTVYNPFTNMDAARARQRITLGLMVKDGYLSAAESDAIYAEPITLVPPSIEIRAPHFVYYVRDVLEARYGPDVLYRGGLRVTTSIDLALQAEAERIALARINELRPRNAHNAAAVIMAPDGRVLAMVGSVDYYNPVIDGQVNVTRAARQPGSALKPFVYALALQRGWTPATVIWDEPTRFVRDDGSVYMPRNYDNAWHGPQRLRMALANSLNIPAVKALEFVGVDAFVQLMQDMGITTLTDPARFGLAMALGSLEVRPLELTAAYNTLRNGGLYRPPAPILHVTNNRGEVLEQWEPLPGRQVLGAQGPQLAYLITDILSDNPARWYMFGRGNVMELPDGRPAAVKTGTSNDWRDSWALGYTPDVTIGVWVGNSDNAPMQAIAGSNGGGIIWRDLMLAYHAERPVQAFTPPAGLAERPICTDTGALASPACPRTTSELFAVDQEPPAADVQYETVQVGGTGDCRATLDTPPEQVRSITYVVYPPEFRAWATRNGIAQPPTQRCAPPATSDRLLAGLIPLERTVWSIGEQVVINGTARGRFRLEVGVGPEPQRWQFVNQGPAPLAAPTLLGIWQTNGLAPGRYTLRLRVTAADGTYVDATQAVTLQAAVRTN